MRQFRPRASAVSGRGPRPLGGGEHSGGLTGSFTGSTATAAIDDSNATFTFTGASCAAGDSTVIADVLAGTHPTYVNTYTVDPPAPTI